MSGTPFNSGTRKLSLIFMAILVVLIALIVLGVITHTFASIFGVSSEATPTQSAPVAIGDDLFYIEAYPWGSVSIDSQTIAHLPIPGQDQPLRLSRGLHRIVWHAVPFQPESCIVFVPPQILNEPSCPYETDVSALAQGRLVTFAPSLTNLPNNQRTALLQQAQAALDILQSSDIVQPGEEYATSPSNGVISVKTAASSLHATLNIQLDTNSTSGRVCPQSNDLCQSPTGQDCRQFCTLQTLGLSPVGQAQLPPLSTSQKTWDVVAVVYAYWDYRTLSGQLVAQRSTRCILHKRSY